MDNNPNTEDKQQRQDRMRFMNAEEPAHQPQRIDPSALSDSLGDSIRRQVSEGNWD